LKGFSGLIIRAFTAAVAASNSLFAMMAATWACVTCALAAVTSAWTIGLVAAAVAAAASAVVASVAAFSAAVWAVASQVEASASKVLKHGPEVFIKLLQSGFLLLFPFGLLLLGLQLVGLGAWWVIFPQNSRTWQRRG
jgi:hypothetical protein